MQVALERVHHHNDHRRDKQRRDGQQQHCQQDPQALCIPFHQFSTSFERVRRSWIKAMAPTIKKKSTALAWPTPSQPVRL